MIELLNTFLNPGEKWIKNNRNQIGYFLIFLSVLSLLFIMSDSGTKESGEKAITVLWILLWLPILSRVFSLDIATALMPLRKELGILMGVLAFVHGGLYIVPYYEELFNYWYLIFGFFSLLITIPLTLTSNNWSMKLLGKYWKYLHRTVYILIILTVIHVVLLKWYLEFEFSVVFLLIAYFIGKILEWNGVRFGDKVIKVYTKGQKWLCVPCGYIYDPAIGDEDSGIPAGTEFNDIPESWTCPLCGVKKSDFVPYNEQEEEVTSIAIVTEKNILNPTTIELTIETESEHKSEPGQFMSFLWKDNDGTFARSYSIARQDRKLYTFLIKLSEKGRGATLLKNLEVGNEVHIRNIGGNFIYHKNENAKIFLATGTGLAPIYRIITTDIAQSKNGKRSLYFTVATEQDLFYTKELKSLENLDLHIHISREKVEGYGLGRVDLDTIEADPNTEWYLCGNPKMVNEAREKLHIKGFKHIYSEEF